MDKQKFLVKRVDQISEDEFPVGTRSTLTEARELTARNAEYPYPSDTFVVVDEAGRIYD